MPIEPETPLRADLRDDLRRFDRRTGIAVDRLRREIVAERLLIRLLDKAPQHWVRFDDWRLEYRDDGPLDALDACGGVREHARAAVDAELRLATQHRGLKSMQIAVHPRDRTPQVAPAPSLVYRLEAFDRDGEIGDVDLLIGFAFPHADEIELLPSLDVSIALDESPPRIPTRSRMSQLAARFGAYTGRTSRFPDPEDLLTIARYAPHLMCTAGRMLQALDREWLRHATPAWPLAMAGPPPWWADAYRRGALELGLDPAMAVGHAWAAALLDPILSATVLPGATWDPRQPGGG